jgi:hypothetical protein
LGNGQKNQFSIFIYLLLCRRGTLGVDKTLVGFSWAMAKKIKTLLETMWLDHYVRLPNLILGGLSQW